MNCVVISPEYGHVIPVLDYGQGPTEYDSDVCLVLGAKTRREAKWAAYRKWRESGTAHVDNTTGPYGNHPLSGVKVEPYPDEAEWPGDDAPADYDETFDEVVRSWRPFVVDLRRVELEGDNQ